jgi:hypothetical protein
MDGLSVFALTLSNPRHGEFNTIELHQPMELMHELGFAPA